MRKSIATILALRFGSLGLFLLLTLCGGLHPLGVRAQYRVELQMEGLRDSSVVLGYYYGDGKYIRDSAKLDGKGRAVFQSDSVLDPGMYLILFPNGQYMDFMVGNECRLKIKTDTLGALEKTTVKGNTLSEDFASFQYFMYSMQKRGREITRLDSLAKEKDSVNPSATKPYKQARALADSLQKAVDTYQEKLLKAHSNDVLGAFIRSLRPVEIPEYTPPANVKNVDSARWMHAYKYNLDHYLDNVDLANPALIRTPLVVPKLDYYLDKILLQIPDTLNRYIDKLMERALRNEFTAKYYAGYLLNKYQLSEIVGMDAVFVHLSDNYYLNHRIPWQDTAFLGRLSKRVEELRPNLVGNLAPDFTVQNIYGQNFHLRDLKSAATLLIFWEPSCSHCKKMLPLVDSVCQIYEPKGLKVVAFMTQGDGPAWQKYLEDHKLFRWHNVWDPYRKSNFSKLYDITSTPVLYVLDEKQRIVMKRIGVESLGPILEDMLVKSKQSGGGKSKGAK